MEQSKEKSQSLSCFQTTRFYFFLMKNYCFHLYHVIFNALLCCGQSHKIQVEKTEVSGNNMTKCETVRRVGKVLQGSLIQIFFYFLNVHSFQSLGEKTCNCMLFSFN